MATKGSPKQPKESTFLVGNALTKLDSVPDGSCRLVIASPPYNIGKSYERDRRLSLDEYKAWIRPILEKATEKMTADGHLCWQTGNYVNDGEVVPLDYIFYEMIAKLGLKLRNRVIWHFNFGLHAKTRFSGRYETLLWFSRSDKYFFNLDPVRVPQLYPGKRHSTKRAGKAGKPSGNPHGKNPSDFWEFNPQEAFDTGSVWNIPNVKAKHPEKTIHPSVFPSELAERCILALTEKNDIILDPFVGTGTSVIAATMHGRIGVGIDKSSEYIKVARNRLARYRAGEAVTRPSGKPIRQPKSGESVATIPEEWGMAAE